MSDATGQPTQEEIEAYYAQLRQAPVGELLMQCIGMLAAGAEAKLGLAEARTLIDGMAALVQLGEPHLGEATQQLKSAVAQLQTGQVQVERQLAARQGGQQATPPQEGAQADGAQAGGRQPQPGQPQPGQPQSGQQPSSQPKATDKLWIPGR